MNITKYFTTNRNFTKDIFYINQSVFDNWQSLNFSINLFSNHLPANKSNGTSRTEESAHL